MSERGFERANQRDGACFVAGSAATAQSCPAEINVAKHLHESTVHQ